VSSTASIEKVLATYEGSFRRRILSGSLIMMLATFHIIFFDLIPDFYDMAIENKDIIIYIILRFGSII
jgi:hypothetical protein